MLNFFNLYGYLWICIVFLYLLGWSDLCMPLDPSVCFFLIITIVTSFFCGYKLKDKFVYSDLKTNRHNNSKIPLILFSMYILNFVYSKHIPLINVLRGQSYLDLDNFGIPHLTLFINAFSICYLAYLSHVFVSFKQKKIIIEIALIVLYFTLLLQRQNIFVCLLIFGNTLLAKNRSLVLEKMNRHFLRNIVIVFVLIAVVLYVMGLVGNMRYGSMWSWDDTSMIMSLGKVNEKYPSFLSGMYFWSYLYAVQPLATLNHTVFSVDSPFDISGFIGCFIPDFISNKVGIQHVRYELIQENLTVGTGYINVAQCMGIIGMIIILFVYVCISYSIVLRCSKNKPHMLVTVINLMAYFFVFTIYDNTFIYSITFFVMIFSWIICYDYKLFSKKIIRF